MHVLNCWSHHHVGNMTLAALRYPAAVRPFQRDSTTHHITGDMRHAIGLRPDCLQVADAQALGNVDVNGRQQSAQLLL
jgi:hypothetical protein